jgi:hypothetical protein
MITAKDKPYSDLKVTKSIDKICIDIRMSWKRYQGLPFRSKFTVNMKWLHYDKFLVYIFHFYIIFRTFCAEGNNKLQGRFNRLICLHID